MLSEKLIFGRLGKPDTKFVRADNGEYVCTYRESETTFAGRRLILRFTIRPAPAETTMAVFEAVDGKWLNISERRLLARGIGFVETARLDLDANAIYCPMEMPKWNVSLESHRGSYAWSDGPHNSIGRYLWHLDWEEFNGRVRCKDYYADENEGEGFFSRIEHFDSDGMAGFIDEYAASFDGVVIREDLYAEGKP